MIHDTISVCTKYTPEAVSVFGPESVSYERSSRETATKFHHFWARAFFVQTPKCKDSMIYAMLRFFRIQFLKNVLVQKCPGRARARPMGQAHIGPGKAPLKEI